MRTPIVPSLLSFKTVSIIFPCTDLWREPKPQPDRPSSTKSTFRDLLIYLFRQQRCMHHRSKTACRTTAPNSPSSLLSRIMSTLLPMRQTPHVVSSGTYASRHDTSGTLVHHVWPMPRQTLNLENRHGIIMPRVLISIRAAGEGVFSSSAIISENGICCF